MGRKRSRPGGAFLQDDEDYRPGSEPEEEGEEDDDEEELADEDEDAEGEEDGTEDEEVRSGACLDHTAMIVGSVVYYACDMRMG